MWRGLGFSSMNEENRLLIADELVESEEWLVEGQGLQEKLPISLEEFRKLYTN